MSIAVRIEPTPEQPGPVVYRWDPDTDILSATVRAAPADDTGTVELEGRDGSWIVLDLAAGRVHGVEVAVWPDVHRRARLAPPSEVVDAQVAIPASDDTRVAAHEVATRLAAEADEASRTIHFTVGKVRHTRTVRIARELLLDLDERDRLAGVWLLDVPPFPTPS